MINLNTEEKKWVDGMWEKLEAKLSKTAVELRDVIPYTTVEQCRASEVVIEKDFVHNGGIYYKNLDDNTDFCAAAATKAGSWSRNDYAASK